MDCDGVRAEPRWKMLKNIEDGMLEFVVPQLHTFLGMTNKVQELNVSKMTKQQSTEMYVKWLKPANIGEAPYFAGTYEGNQCNALVKNRACLRQLVETWDNNEEFLDICDAFDALAEVNNKCYKVKTGLTDEDLREIKSAIEKMEEVWLKLGLTITVKSEGLFRHGYDIMAKYRVTLAVLGEQDAESIHRLAWLLKQLYPNHMSPELWFKRFNAERFLPLPSKPTRQPRKIQCTESADVRPHSGIPYAVPTEPELELQDAFDYLNGLIDAESNTPEDPVADLNTSFAESILDDDDETVCHLGENTDILSAEYELEKQKNYDISEDFEKNPLLPFFFEEL